MNNTLYMYEHEKKTQHKRQLIAAAIASGWTYERIQRELGVGTSTISAVKKMMTQGGQDDV